MQGPAQSLRKEKIMSQALVRALQGNIESAFSLVTAFMEVCPEEIWSKKFGGWPVAHQLYHALNVAVLFVDKQKGADLNNPCPEAGNLSGSAGPAPSKAQAREFLATVKGVVNNYIDGLTDETLAQKNETVSGIIGQNYTHASVMALLASHTYYHLGSCDAALREHGLKGVF